MRTIRQLEKEIAINTLNATEQSSVLKTILIGIVVAFIASYSLFK